MENQYTWPGDKEVGFNEFITMKLNQWRNVLIDRTMTYYEGLHRFKRDKKEVVITSTGPRPIADICSIRLSALKEASFNVKKLQELLVLYHEKKLEDLWTDEALTFLIPSDPKDYETEGK